MFPRKGEFWEKEENSESWNLPSLDLHSGRQVSTALFYMEGDAAHPWPHQGDEVKAGFTARCS